MSRSKTKHKSRENIRAQKDKNIQRKKRKFAEKQMKKIIRVGASDSTVPESVLYEKTSDYDLSSDTVLRVAKDDVQELTEVLSATGFGVGLANPQIGNLANAIVWRVTPQSEIKHAINPEIISTGEETHSMNEGCLSYPGFYVEVERPIDITVKYYTTDGEQHEKEFSGWEARIVQHEVDHLRQICKVGEAPEDKRIYAKK